MARSRGKEEDPNRKKKYIDYGSSYHGAGNGGSAKKVNKVSTTEWPSGVASKLIDLLKEDYQPNDQVAAVKRKGSSTLSR
eukprot:8449258-Ditylum_brightwellii.AAC.1